MIGGAVLLIAIIGFIFISTYNDFDWRSRTEVAQEWTRYATAFSISYNRPTTSRS